MNARSCETTTCPERAGGISKRGWDYTVKTYYRYTFMTICICVVMYVQVYLMYFRVWFRVYLGLVYGLLKICLGSIRVGLKFL
jgi:hypothetical protein